MVPIASHFSAFTLTECDLWKSSAYVPVIKFLLEFQTLSITFCSAFLLCQQLLVRLCQKGLLRETAKLEEGKGLASACSLSLCFLPTCGSCEASFRLCSFIPEQQSLPIVAAESTLEFPAPV